jgi:hypothetical protein
VSEVRNKQIELVVLHIIVLATEVIKAGYIQCSMSEEIRNNH